tara:strand:- start:627 stop:2540 length:1914 start_codon:yes stop_codon:yes gene_type:complete
MGADATLVTAAYRMGMANVPGDWSASFNKQYEGIIAANKAKAGFISKVGESLGNVAMAKIEADAKADEKLGDAFGMGDKTKDLDDAEWQKYLNDLPEDQKEIWSNIKNQEYKDNISSFNPEGDLAAGYMQKVAGENSDAYQKGAGMNSIFSQAGWNVPTEIHKNISEINKKTFKTRKDKQYISEQYARLENWKQDRIKDKGYMKAASEMIDKRMVNTKNMNPQVMALLGQLMDSKGDLSSQGISAWNRKGDDKLMISFTPNRIRSIYDYNKSLQNSGPLDLKFGTGTEGLNIKKEKPMLLEKRPTIDTDFKPMVVADRENTVSMSWEEIFGHAKENLIQTEAETGIIGKINSVIDDAGDRDTKSNTFKNSWETYGPKVKRDLRGFIKGAGVIKDFSTRDILEKGSTYKEDVGNMLVGMDLAQLGIPDKGEPGYADDLKNNDLKRQIIDRITNPQTLSDVAFAEEEMINYFHNISKQSFDTKRAEIEDAETKRLNALNNKPSTTTTLFGNTVPLPGSAEERQAFAVVNNIASGKSEVVIRGTTYTYDPKTELYSYPVEDEETDLTITREGLISRASEAYGNISSNYFTTGINTVIATQGGKSLRYKDYEKRSDGKWYVKGGSKPSKFQEKLNKIYIPK